MEVRSLGSGVGDVTCVGFGGMPLSIAGRPDVAESVRVLHAALDAGMTLIDTADVYCLDDDDIGHNERLIERALREWSGNADSIVVATKGGLTRPAGRWESDASPDHLRVACEASLRALGVETAGNSVQGQSDATLTGVIDAPSFRDAILNQRDLVAGSSAVAVSPATVTPTADPVLVEIRDSLLRIEGMLGQKDGKA